MTNNVNDIYFDGHYKDVWKAIIPEELTAKETEFLVTHFKLGPGSKVLDLMCGYGRHAIALGRKGIQVTAVDNLKEYIDEIGSTSKKEGLPVKAVKESILDFKSDDKYDLVICMGNSINFFNAEDLSKIFSNIKGMMKKESYLFLNSWSIAEIAIKSFTKNSWEQVGDIKFLTSNKFLFRPTRIESRTIMITPKGEMENKIAIDYIYSISEIQELLAKNSIELMEIYSIPGKKLFALGDPRVYFIGKRI